MFPIEEGLILGGLTKTHENYSLMNIWMTVTYY
jgi:hypothetical protein